MGCGHSSTASTSGGGECVWVRESVCLCVCVRGCEWVSECVCLCTWERVWGCERVWVWECEGVCVWECVCERGCVCVCERERVWVCERMCVWGCERMCVWGCERVYECESVSECVWENVWVCVWERECESVRECMSVRVSEWVCVRERERERERESVYVCIWVCVWVCESERVCVYVFVYEFVCVCVYVCVYVCVSQFAGLQLWDQLSLCVWHTLLYLAHTDPGSAQSVRGIFCYTWPTLILDLFSLYMVHSALPDFDLIRTSKGTGGRMQALTVCTILWISIVMLWCIVITSNAVGFPWDWYMLWCIVISPMLWVFLQTDVVIYTDPHDAVICVEVSFWCCISINHY